MPLTILKMLANKVMNDLGFSDLGRLLQQTASDNTTAGSEREEHNVAGVYLFGFIMLVIAIFACIRRRENVVDVPELPGDKTVHKTPKSTFAQRKRDILDLFETSEVTMMVTKDDILLRAEYGCVEDIESAFDEEGGILKLSRPVDTSSNPTKPDASNLLPPSDWCDVPNLCAICLDSYQPGQLVAWSSGCRHAFHQDCISHYLAKKMIGGQSPCPSCRQKFCDLPAQPLTSSSAFAPV